MCSPVPELQPFTALQANAQRQSGLKDMLVKSHCSQSMELALSSTAVGKSVHKLYDLRRKHACMYVCLANAISGIGRGYVVAESHSSAYLDTIHAGSMA